MTMQIRVNPVAVAVAAAFALAATSVWAHGRKDDYSDHAWVHTGINIHKDLTVSGKIEANGTIASNADAEALVQGDQYSVDQQVTNKMHKNDATVNTNVLNSASGNIGVNQAAGDNNIQSNALALADQNAVFGQATSQVMFDQGAFGNTANNTPAANSASLYNNVLNGASGNIGVNIAAGDSNVQRNGAAISVGNNNLSIATVSSEQKNAGNDTDNEGAVSQWGTQAVRSGDVLTTSYSKNASFKAGFAANGAFSKSGNGSHSYRNDAATDNATSVMVSGSTTCNGGACHASGTKSVDDPLTANVMVSVSGNGSSGSATANGDVNQDTLTTNSTSWKFARNFDFSKKFHANGSIQAQDVQQLAEVCTKYIPVPLQVSWSYDTANLSNGVLNNASGNIGVNMAAGTNNLQENVMALAATPK